MAAGALGQPVSSRPVNTPARNDHTPDLRAPLPQALAGRAHGWFTDYRRWPVFSPAWVRGRARSVGVLVTVLHALLLGSAAVGAAPAVPLGGFVQLTLAVLLPLFAGPWLGALARRRALARGADARTELAGVAAALLAVLLALAAFHQWGAEPMKQAIAEATGMVDETGQRRRVTLSIGIFIRGAEGEPADDGVATPTAPPLATQLSFAFAGALLAGGLALPRLRRERDGLRALAAEEALARAQQQRREAELRLSVLAAQVEPHFLFNTLAGVRSAITTDPARAAALIDHLAEYLRAAIPRLRLPCPPLMLVSLVENAVKHGAEPKVGPVHVALSAALEADGRLRVVVDDDGAGFGASAGGGGIGLANIRERLAHMHGGRASLSLSARPEGGVRAVLTLPVETAA